MTCVVVPTYEEAENLPALIAGVRAGLDCTIGVVDDGSRDGTGELAEALADWVIHRERKAGLASAYVAGFRRALADGHDRVVQMDADLSHDPADLPRLLATEADLAIGSRYVPGGRIEGWPLYRALLSRAGCAYARAVLGCEVRDLTGGFKAWRAAALEAIDLDAIAAGGFAFQVETTYRALRAGRTVAEVPIVFRERRAGRSKLSAGIAAEALWRIPALR
jgi:dolichol-phosphate mannosyltransferase